jgi:hypothetical protein
MVARTYWRDGKYWFLNDNLRWEAYQKEDMFTILKGTFFFHNIIADQIAARWWKVGKFEAFKCRILTRNNVTFVGELAGHKKGITTWNGDNYLITKGPIIIKPREGEFSTIRGILDDLFGEEQLAYLHAWLKTSYEALRDGEMSTGQVLVLAGPAGIGKSFIKEFIIRPILGGRHTDPTSYLQGKTHFNANTARAESWEIDDSVGISDSHKRKMYTAAFKKLAASNDHRIEAKGKDAIQPPPVFHRLSVYTNDDAYDLWVLPAMSDSLVDKAVILKAHRAEKPSIRLPAVNERAAFREKIAKELPAFVYWLTQWVIPEDLTNGRYGVKAYQHSSVSSPIYIRDEGTTFSVVPAFLVSWCGVRRYYCSRKTNVARRGWRANLEDSRVEDSGLLFLSVVLLRKR